MKKELENLLKRASGRHAHPYVPELANDYVKGEVSRRDFLRTASLLGVSATAAYGFAWRVSGPFWIPEAGAAQGKMGGELRWAMAVQEMTDPATFDWTEKANVARWIVEYLTRTKPDNVTVPYLAESWEANEDLTQWTFKLRRDVTWSNGDAFNADDVVYNFQRWLDPRTGSSNLSLFSGLTETYTTKNDQGETVSHGHRAPPFRRDGRRSEQEPGGNGPVSARPLRRGQRSPARPAQRRVGLLGEAALSGRHPLHRYGFGFLGDDGRHGLGPGGRRVRGGRHPDRRFAQPAGRQGARGHHGAHRLPAHAGGQTALRRPAGAPGDHVGGGQRAAPPARLSRPRHRGGEPPRRADAPGIRRAAAALARRRESQTAPCRGRISGRDRHQHRRGRHAGPLGNGNLSGAQGTARTRRHQSGDQQDARSAVLGRLENHTLRADLLDAPAAGRDGAQSRLPRGFRVERDTLRQSGIRGGAGRGERDSRPERTAQENGRGRAYPAE